MTEEQLENAISYMEQKWRDIDSELSGDDDVSTTESQIPKTDD